MFNTARQEAAQQARLYLDRQPVYLDTETTGTGPTAEVIEIGIVDTDGSLLFESLVKPRGPVDPGATRVHNITREMLQTAPGWSQVWPRIEEVLRGRSVGVYNAEFDLRLLKQSNQRNWLGWATDDSLFFCIMKLYARFYGEWDVRRGAYRYISLENAGQQSGISLPNSHRAQDDALLARALLEYMAR